MTTPLIIIPNASDFANAALTAFFLGVAESDCDLTTAHDDPRLAEIYDVGRAIGCAVLGRD